MLQRKSAYDGSGW